MALQANEDCPVCWRSFSALLILFTIPCGHSLCPECSVGLIRCPLCRKRLITGYSRVQNYSLLSLLDRIANLKPVSRDQQIQTDHTVIAKKTNKPLISLEATATAMLAKPLNLKFHKDHLGNIKRFDIRFK